MNKTPKLSDTMRTALVSFYGGGHAYYKTLRALAQRGLVTATPHNDNFSKNDAGQALVDSWSSPPSSTETKR